MRVATTLLFALALACGGQTATASTLARKLDAKAASERKAAALELAKLGERAEPAVPALNKTVLDPEADVRLAAVSALVAVGAAGRRGLATALNDSEESVRLAAANGLAKLGPAAGKSSPNLIDALDDPSTAVAEAARRAVTAIGEDAVPPLLRVVIFGSNAAREHATVALVAIGEPSLPGLVEAMDSNSVEARKAALSAVASILDSAAPPAELDAALRERFEDDDASVAEAARRLHARL